ncbi:hypothetical protein [Burkholderia ambifaria]|uniref:hypothetical protein n=1 Tax=Burkholderia ambifaria TaxID=152480 RepID=UPI00158852B1|nr:hypothetical protein [Burkholderia ambifaria]
MRIVLLTAAAFALCGCAAQHPEHLTSDKQWKNYGLSVDRSAQARRDIFVGRWYDRQNANDGSQTMSVMEIKSDGTYSEVWRTLEKNGRVKNANEKGVWGVSGNIFFTITTGRAEEGGAMVNVDQRDAYYYDAYFIDDASESGNSIRHILTGDEFVSRRVGDDFLLPSF